MMRKRLATMTFRRFFQTGAAPELRVTAVEGRLIAFAEERKMNSGSMTIKVGDLVFGTEKDPVAVVAFQTKSLNFAVNLRPTDTFSSSVMKGDTLKLEKGKKLRLSRFDRVTDAIDVFKACNWSSDQGIEIFRGQPRDIERSVIRSSWYNGIAAVDTLTPVGRGQSMLFTTEYDVENKERLDRYMRNICLGAIKGITNPDLHCYFSVPSQTPGPSLDSPVFAKDELVSTMTKHQMKDKYTMITAASDSREDSACLDFLASYVACSVAETRRDVGGHSMLVLPSLHSNYIVWRRAQRLAAQFYEEFSGSLPSSMFAPGVDRADLRQFYSSLLQRSAAMHQDKGSGTLTTLHGMFESRNLIADTSERTFSLEEMNSVPRLESEQQRLQMLDSKGVAMTITNLKKLGIRAPVEIETDPVAQKAAWGLSGPLTEPNSRTQHSEELKSISDGHIVMNPIGSYFDFDICNSLTRIGIGKNQHVFGDTRAFALKQVAGALRIHAANLLDVLPEMVGELPPRVKALSYALHHHHDDILELEIQVALVLAVWSDMIAPHQYELIEGGSRSKLVRRLREGFPPKLATLILDNKHTLTESQLDSLRAYIKDQLY